MRLPESRRDVLLLEPGVHALTAAALAPPGVEADQEPLANVYVDSRGVWLKLRDGLRGAYVNGRPIRQMAMLRGGDALFVQGSEVLLVGREPDRAPEGGQPPRRGPVRCVLRAVGGPLHGRCFSLSRPIVIGASADADVRIDDARVAARHVEVQPLSNGVAIAVLVAGSVLVNGHRVDDALLQSGDQLVLAGTHRFIVEAPRPLNEPEKEAPPPTRAAAPVRPVPRSVRRIPWLLFAALLLAGALGLLLLYGAG